MIYQNDPRLSTNMQKWGCFIRACILIAERALQKEATVEQITSIEKWTLDEKYIDDKYNVQKSAPIIAHSFVVLGTPTRVAEIGTRVNGTPYFYKGVLNPRVDASIGKYVQNGPSGTHFVVRDGDRIIDPHLPPITLIKEVYTILYRIG